MSGLADESDIEDDGKEKSRMTCRLLAWVAGSMVALFTELEKARHEAEKRNSVLATSS